MNSGFYKDLDTNFEKACIMAENDFSQEELIALLKQGNIPEKQIAAMKITRVNAEEASILINNLTGQDGKIREAVACKIKEFLFYDNKYIQIFSKYPFDFAKATIDINGNICRIIVDCISILKSDKTFTKEYTSHLLGFISDAFNSLDKIIYRDKKYTVNKQLFKLYWCLESLKLFSKNFNKTILIPLLQRACKEKEYTIREKAAQIINTLDDNEYLPIKEILKNDENYYVREVFKIKQK